MHRRARVLGVLERHPQPPPRSPRRPEEQQPPEKQRGASAQHEKRQVKHGLHHALVAFHHRVAQLRAGRGRGVAPALPAMSVEAKKFPEGSLKALVGSDQRFSGRK